MVIRELLVYVLILLFVGSIIYSVIIADKEPVKKHS
jgi:hypothetical protein